MSRSRAAHRTRIGSRERCRELRRLRPRHRPKGEASGWSLAGIGGTSSNRRIRTSRVPRLSRAPLNVVATTSIEATSPAGSDGTAASSSKPESSASGTANRWATSARGRPRPARPSRWPSQKTSTRANRIDVAIDPSRHQQPSRRDLGIAVGDIDPMLDPWHDTILTDVVRGATRCVADLLERRSVLGRCLRSTPSLWLTAIERMVRSTPWGFEAPSLDLDAQGQRETSAPSKDAVTQHLVTAGTYGVAHGKRGAQPHDHLGVARVRALADPPSAWCDQDPALWSLR